VWTGLGSRGPARLAERARLDDSGDVAVRRRQHAHVDGDEAATANALELPLLEHAKQRDLRLGLQVADLVQEDGSAVGLPIEIPPLRDRREDILLLLQYTIERYARKTGKTISSIDGNTLEMFRAYGWPGNVRELQNVVERALIVAREKPSWSTSRGCGAPPRPSAERHKRLGRRRPLAECSLLGVFCLFGTRSQRRLTAAWPSACAYRALLARTVRCSILGVVHEEQVGR
jgi:transcriptional regulator with AAA-type ATPase domain